MDALGAGQCWPSRVAFQGTWLPSSPAPGSALVSYNDAIVMLSPCSRAPPFPFPIQGSDFYPHFTGMEEGQGDWEISRAAVEPPSLLTEGNCSGSPSFLPFRVPSISFLNASLFSPRSCSLATQVFPRLTSMPQKCSGSLMMPNA